MPRLSAALRRQGYLRGAEVEIIDADAAHDSKVDLTGQSSLGAQRLAFVVIGLALHGVTVL